MTMQLGSAGEALIKSFETLKLAAYLDLKGIPTIGWGHTGWIIHPNNIDGGIPVELGRTCTSAQAEGWFLADTDATVEAVNKLCSFVPLTQNQFDALVSFTFNTGIHAFAHSTLLQKLKQGLFSQIPAEFYRWDYADHHEIEGLEKRRRAEALLFSQDAPVHVPV